MSSTISPHSSTTVGISEKRPGCLKPKVEIQRIQKVAGQLNNLLAAESLQNSAARCNAQPWIVLFPPEFCPRIKSGPGEGAGTMPALRAKAPSGRATQFAEEETTMARDGFQ